MKNIKKVIVGVLSLVIIFTITGCGNKEEVNKKTTAELVCESISGKYQQYSNGGITIAEYASELESVHSTYCKTDDEKACQLLTLAINQANSKPKELNDCSNMSDALCETINKSIKDQNEKKDSVDKSYMISTYSEICNLDSN